MIYYWPYCTYYMLIERNPAVQFPKGTVKSQATHLHSFWKFQYKDVMTVNINTNISCNIYVSLLPLIIQVFSIIVHFQIFGNKLAKHHSNHTLSKSIAIKYSNAQEISHNDISCTRCRWCVVVMMFDKHAYFFKYDTHHMIWYVS